jgi:ribosome-associated protein
LSESRELAESIAGLLDENKAEDIVVLDVGDQVWITDYFVIATGQSEPHIRFLQRELSKHVSEEEQREPSLSEGNPDEEWLLTDFGDVIVHIFTEDQREYYDLEGLWADAEVIRADVAGEN